jgi:serine/threonine-protein kinase
MSEHLGKYRIDGILGKGAMGVVYKAFDPYIQRVVALKTIRKELFGEGQMDDLISRLKNEAQAAGRLNHSNIVMVYDYGEDNELAYIAMEFVEGTTLNAMIQAHQRIESLDERPLARLAVRSFTWCGPSRHQTVQFDHHIQ